jgi:flagellar M-ring protein FliF
LQASKTESGTYGVSKTVRHKVENSGKVRRMTAAVVVNDRRNKSNQAGAIEWQPRSAEELRKITLLAEAATGFDSARGDVVTVQAISFEENRDLPAPSLAKRALSTIQQSPEATKYLAVLLAILIIVIFGVRPAIRQSTTLCDPEVSQSKLTTSPQPPLLADLSSEEEDFGRIRTQEVLERVTEQMKKEPTQSSRLLQSWIHSE